MQCENILSIFPVFLQELLAGLGMDMRHVQEIRIRAGRPLLAVCRNREYMSHKAVSSAQTGEILAYLSHYSLYAYEDEIRQGFLSLPGGHRAGLSGRAVIKDGQVRTVTDISSLNIRFAHEVKGCADGLLPFLWEGGRLLHTLLVSAPGCGKTTLLRDCIRQISDGCAGHRGLTVAVVDERSEIAGSLRGVPGCDLGMRTDILDGCPKAAGMRMMVRAMAPRVVAVDEIGGREDVEALTAAMHWGCTVLATVHGDTMEGLQKAPALKELTDMEMFQRYVFLDAGQTPGRIRDIRDGKGKRLYRGEDSC